MGLADASPKSMMKIWGPDRVHPISEAYNTMASRSWTRSTLRLSSMQDCQAPDLPHLVRIEEPKSPGKVMSDKGKTGHAALRLLLIASTKGAATT